MEPEDDDVRAEAEYLAWQVENAHKVRLYNLALDELRLEDKRYISNWNTWWRWDDRLRLWWIEQIEAQARAGQNTIGVAVVSRAVEIRLRG